jgi:polyribonucleotide nucleotidyltransferase
MRTLTKCVREGELVKVFNKTVALEGTSEIQFETGRLAKQANGAVIVTAGETVLLCTVCHADPRPGLDFFPLTVEYREKPYAAGKIPGGFFKRPGRPTDKEIIGCRLIDRPMRPLFPEGYKDEVQLILSVLSYDGVNEPDVLAITGASAALSISDIPFAGPAAAVRVGYLDGKFVTNFTPSDDSGSSLDLIVAGTAGAITMVEAKSENVSEAVLVDALKFAHEQIKIICKGQQELADECGKAKMEFTADLASDELKAEVLELAMPTLIEASKLRAKFEISNKLSEGKAIITEAFAERVENGEVSKEHVRESFSNAQKSFFRKQILEENQRPDGRRTDEVRPLTIEVGVLPRTHGSAVFTRGETQALGVVTLGISEDEQLIESLQPTYRDRFMLHYNFPPFSVGEARMMRGPGRREIGHGTLAKKALMDSVPPKTVFPYTVRIVSEILESNGSSSMATVCAGSLALMDAGVPVTDAVAGIAMGLVMAEDNKNYAVLTDIQGWEDHYGDMDFKVAGTKDGVTALQMDIKIAGLNLDIMTQALEQAKEARIHILNKMAETIAEPRDDISN